MNFQSDFLAVRPEFVSCVIVWCWKGSWKKKRKLAEVQYLERDGRQPKKERVCNNHVTPPLFSLLAYAHFTTLISDKTWSHIPAVFLLLQNAYTFCMFLLTVWRPGNQFWSYESSSSFDSYTLPCMVNPPARALDSINKIKVSPDN